MIRAAAEPIHLAITNFSFQYPSGREPVLMDVSLLVAGGEVVALAGPNGCGKTTLLRAAAGMMR
jgi:ABC-type cobalamin/Fe3+-siderophores transport system ATPase subunit